MFCGPPQLGTHAPRAHQPKCEARQAVWGRCIGPERGSLTQESFVGSAGSGVYKGAMRGRQDGKAGHETGRLLTAHVERLVGEQCGVVWSSVMPIKEEVMRNVLIAVAVAALAVPLVGRAQEGGNEAEGWETRLDSGTDPTGVLHFRTMGDGVHASTAGRGGAIFWQPNSTATGNFTISASFTQTEPSGHPNAYGLFWGGSDLSGPNQQYSYFVIRQGGMCHIKRRMGSETPTVVDWTAASAINDLDADGRSTNTLTVEVGSSQVRFLVNDMEVATLPRSEVDTDGITGLRVTHLLDVHIGDLMLGM